MRIVIADDQKNTRNGLKAVLSATLSSPEIWEATTGLEAERLAEEVQPHLIVMDVRMPELDGVSATRRIKSVHPEIKILVLSLNAGSSTEALAAGADAFVSKGEGPERLLAAIEALADEPGQP
ncbi:MAG TPA: response regulator transcription factor [Spirochaetia bacterium]|nr:response regulator transcription factor [Spirochaetia bacterium]